MPGVVAGLARRFWQASPDHRGTPEAPGRVCTLLPAETVLALEHPEGAQPTAEAVKGSVVHGMAYHVPASCGAAVMEGLLFREKAGYEQRMVEVMGEGGTAVSALAFVGTPDNEHFAGFQPDATVAGIIAHSSGPSGPNSEYFLRLYHGLTSRDTHLEAVYAALKEESSEGVARFEAELGV